MLARGPGYSYGRPGSSKPGFRRNPEVRPGIRTGRNRGLVKVRAFFGADQAKGPGPGARQGKRGLSAAELPRLRPPEETQSRRRRSGEGHSRLKQEGWNLGSASEF